MKVKETIKKIAESLYIYWTAVIAVAIAWLLLIFTKNPKFHFAATCMALPLVGIIEAVVIHNKLPTFTKWYIPVLPKKIDWPIAVATPIVFVIKAILMWHYKETITVWWAVGAIIENWIVAHLCSFEREQKT